MRRRWRLGRVWRLGPESSLQWGLGALEAMVQRDVSGLPNAFRPVFLVGAPRCGSTLIMQVLTDAFRFGYLTNRHCRYRGAPALAERVLRPLADKVPSNYRAIHGRTRLPSDPAECGGWWYQFFRREPAYVTIEDVSEGKMMSFRRSIRRFESAVELPLIFKNLYASLRLEPIAHYLPEAVFVVVERDWIENAQSILRARFDALHDFNHWWSVPPPGVDALSRRPPVEQVVGQIQSIHDLIDRDVRRLGLEDRTYRIRYEAFCEDVASHLEDFRAFMETHGVRLERRFEVPGQFSISRSVKIPSQMYRDLCAEVHARAAATDSANEG